MRGPGSGSGSRTCSISAVGRSWAARRRATRTAKNEQGRQRPVTHHGFS